ncbi:MAG TPA: hypothetical protein VGG98_08090 [Solirubrobacteraceae bacterium]
MVEELRVALGVVTLIVVLLAVLFSSPDQRPSTIARWSRQQPVDFLATAVAELGGTSGTAEYGPPYNHNGEGQHAAFLRPQKWLGVSHPIDTAEDYVIGPLRMITGDPALRREIAEYESAKGYLKDDGIRGYEKALEKASVAADGSVTVRPGEYENVDALMRALLGLAQSGSLDGYLLTVRQPYQTDYTRPLLFMADGGLLQERANGQHLLGDQWGMMNETGSYPGQAWLWLYALWYQIEPFKASPNADLLVMLVMATLSLAFVCVPLLPGIRDIPRWLPLYRLIWRKHYRSNT